MWSSISIISARHLSMESWQDTPHLGLCQGHHTSLPIDLLPACATNPFRSIPTRKWQHICRGPKVGRPASGATSDQGHSFCKLTSCQCCQVACASVHKHHDTSCQDNRTDNHIFKVLLSIHTAPARMPSAGLQTLPLERTHQGFVCTGRLPLGCQR